MRSQEHADAPASKDRFLSLAVACLFSTTALCAGLSAQPFSAADRVTFRPYGRLGFGHLERSRLGWDFRVGDFYMYTPWSIGLGFSVFERFSTSDDYDVLIRTRDTVNHTGFDTTVSTRFAVGSWLVPKLVAVPFGYARGNRDDGLSGFVVYPFLYCAYSGWGAKARPQTPSGAGLSQTQWLRATYSSSGRTYSPMSSTLSV